MRIPVAVLQVDNGRVEVGAHSQSKTTVAVLQVDNGRVEDHFFISSNFTFIFKVKNVAL